MNDDAQRSARSQVALLIVDLQRGMQRHDLPPRNNPGAEARIVELLAAWRAAGWPVVHVRHVSRQPGSPFAPGQPGVEFQPALAPRDDEAVFEKNVPDAFINSGLQRWLHVRDIRQVALVGVATENSVEASARSAGNLGFQTWVVADACFTFAKPDFHGTRAAPTRYMRWRWPTCTASTPWYCAPPNCCSACRPDCLPGNSGTTGLSGRRHAGSAISP